MLQETSRAPKPLVLRPARSEDYQPLLNGTPQTCGMRSGCVPLTQGQECGQHSTKAHEEVLVILEGAGTARLEGHDDLQVRAGDVVYIPPHTTHNIANTGDGLLRYIYIVAPVKEQAGGQQE